MTQSSNIYNNQVPTIKRNIVAKILALSDAYAVYKATIVQVALSIKANFVVQAPG